MVAAAVALAVAELVAVVTGPGSSPLVAVGGVVVDHAPRPMVEFGIRVFGTLDKPALLVGTVLLVAGCAAALGAAAVRRLWIGLAGLAVFAAIGVAAAVSRPDADPGALLPTLAGAAAAAFTYTRLRSRMVAPSWTGPGEPGVPGGSRAQSSDEPGVPGGGRAQEHGEPGVPGGDHAPEGVERPPLGPAGGRDAPVLDRRRLLRVAGLTVGAAAVAGVGAHWWSLRRDVAAARGAVTLPAPTDPAGPVPTGADLRLPGLASYVTANDEFYRIDTALVPPQVDPADWRLRIHGRVARPYEITFAELLARPMVERYITLACVSNQVGGELIGNARWLGVPVRDLIAAAEPLPDADQVVSRSVDGWTCGTPTEVLTDGRDALLAVGMNGEPLPLAHGFPVRMVVPGLYGYVSACKWITELELSRFDDFDAYWVPRGWAPRAPVKTQSRIDTPRSQARPGPVTVAGVAWAQHRGVARVEVRVDGGPWHEAALAEAVSVDTWRQWSWRWDATPGDHELVVRATDATGAVQLEQRSPAAPDGATGWHTVRVQVA